MAKQLPPPLPLHALLQALYNFSLLCSLFTPLTLAKSTTYNVVDFGADPNGQIDSTNAFLGAWNKACGSPKPARIHVPQGQFLLGSATKFSGQCNNKGISITIDGTLVAPSDYRVIGESLYWLTFDHVSGVKIRGGVLDGRGTSLWDCKNSGQACPVGATVSSMNIMIENFTIFFF